MLKFFLVDQSNGVSELYMAGMQCNVIHVG